MADDNDKDKQPLPPVIAPPSAPPGVLPAAITGAPAPQPAPPPVAAPSAQLPAPHEGFLAHLYQREAGIQNPFLRGLARTGTGIARAAEGIATPFAPELAFVPGTEANAMAQTNQDVRRFATQEKANQEAGQAAAAKENAVANTSKAESESENALTNKQKEAYAETHPRPMPAVETPQQKEQSAIREAMAKLGYYATFGDNGQMSVAPIAGFQAPQKVQTPEEQVFASLLKNGATPEQALQQLLKDKQKLGGAYGQFGPAFLAYHLMNQAYQENPALLPILAPVLSKMFSASGEPMGPEAQKILAKPPEGQPLSPETKNPIGLHMPEAPTGATRAQAQTAARVVTELPRIRKEVQSLGSELGPIQGRWNEFLTGKVGTGDPRFEQLRTDMEFLSAAAAKFHLNSVRAVDKFDTLAQTGKMTAPVLNGFLDAMEKWAVTAQTQERGYGQSGVSDGHPNATVPTGWNWTKQGGKWGITDGKSFRPYQGK